MHEWGWRRVFTWSAIGAAASGVLLAAACSGVEDTSCWPVPLFAVGTWGLAGLIFGGTLASSSGRDVLPVAEEIRPYVRFPQGLPDMAETSSSNP
jgi:hypothetical protein